MGDEKSSSSTIMASRDREPRDRELLIPVADSTDEDASFKPSSSSSISHHTGREVNFYCCLFRVCFLFDCFVSVCLMRKLGKLEGKFKFFA